MKPGYTDVTIIVDRSGSMESCKQAVIDGVNRFLDEHQDGPGEVLLSLIQFDDQYEVVHSATRIDQIAELSDDTYVPRGSTALLDALGHAIDDAGHRFATMPELERPAKVLVIVFTDGLENSSVRFSWKEVAARIRLQREVYSWEFAFVGASEDTIAQAAMLEIPSGAVALYRPTSAGTGQAMASVSASVMRVRTGRSMAFSAAERARMREAS